MKNYIGEGKSAKNFAKEYLERRSKFKNAQKRRKHEDDLLTPAQAINPNDGMEEGGSGFQTVKAGGNKGRRRGKTQKGKPADASHLLGFNVTAGNRVNAGELDVPQWECSDNRQSAWNWSYLSHKLFLWKRLKVYSGRLFIICRWMNSS